MSLLFESIPRWYNFLIHDLADVRTKHMFFMDPIPLVVLLCLYNLFVLKVGQNWMKNREPFNLKKIILVFDFVQIIVNAITFYKGVELGWFWKFSFFCTEFDPTDNPHSREVAFYCYFYYLIKISDLLDTVFFVLTKKFSHISFLHIYHHTGMVLLAWGCAKYYPYGHHTFIGVLNSLVHVIMYTYYLVTTIYPQKKLFKVKKFVTEVQMYQFLIAFIVQGLTLLTPNCNYPKFTHFILMPNNLMIFLLFYNFYRRTYFPKNTKKVN